MNRLRLFKVNAGTRHGWMTALWLMLPGALLVAAWVVGGSQVARAYVPSLREVYALLDARPELGVGVYVESVSYVYPLESAELAGGDSISEVTPEAAADRSFRQLVYWAPRGTLAMLTHGLDGEVLSHYLDEGVTPVWGNAKEERRFTPQDLLPVYMPFIWDGAQRWREGMAQWGIYPDRVELVRGSKDRLLYRLTGANRGAVYLEPDLMRVVAVEIQLEGSGRNELLRVEFMEFYREEIGRGEQSFEISYPRVINYLLDGRLFRQTRGLRFLTYNKEPSSFVNELRKWADGQGQPSAMRLPGGGAQ